MGWVMSGYKGMVILDCNKLTGREVCTGSLLHRDVTLRSSQVCVPHDDGDVPMLWVCMCNLQFLVYMVDYTVVDVDKLDLTTTT